MKTKIETQETTGATAHDGEAFRAMVRDFAAWVTKLARDCQDDLQRADAEMKTQLAPAVRDWDAERTTGDSEVLRDYLGNAIAAAENRREIEKCAPLLEELRAGRVDFSMDAAFEFWFKFLVANGRFEEWEKTGLEYSDLPMIFFEAPASEYSRVAP
jgi:hypothetical protein